MLFPARLHHGLRSGAITLTFRRWSRAQAKAGGRYRLDPDGVMVVGAVRTVPTGGISDADARRAGYRDHTELLRDLERHGGALDDAASVYRVEFQYEAERDPRLALRAQDAITEEEMARVLERLAKMDRSGAYGSWTKQTLEIIEAQPRVLSTTLAEQLGRERLPFKTDVRKLKSLGLTISHDVGYELSPRGRAVLRRLRDRM